MLICLDDGLNKYFLRQVKKDQIESGLRYKLKNIIIFYLIYK